MTEQAVAPAPRIAQASGIYRCTGYGQTHYREPGDPLEEHECQQGVPCAWELRKEDNLDPADAVVVFIGHGIIHAIETDELPEVGKRLNIREALGCGLKTGEHRVTLVQDDFQWDSKSFIRVEVERVGDLADDLPIHQASQVTV